MRTPAIVALGLGLAACSPGAAPPSAVTQSDPTRPGSAVDPAVAPTKPPDVGPPATTPPPPVPQQPAAPLALPTCVPADAGVIEFWRTPAGDFVVSYRNEAQKADPPIDDYWTFSLATTTWTPRERHAYPSADSPAPDTSLKHDASGDVATTCAPGHKDCRDVTLPKITLDADDQPTITANTARTMIAVMSRDTVRVFDTAGKPLAVVKSWKTPMVGDGPSFFRSVSFANEALAVYIADTPVSSAIRLFDPHTGAKIGDVDQGKPMVGGVTPIELPKHRAGFVELDGNSLIIQDTGTGKVVARHTLPGAPDPSLNEGAASADGTAVFFITGAVAYRVDVASGKVTTFDAPKCP